MRPDTPSDLTTAPTTIFCSISHLISSQKFFTTMSLSQQLNVIADNSASLVVDRKTRSKIHSKSLIFEPKIAATQDYELIYQIGLEGLDELISIDKRFIRFEKTLFNETTINFDRNVQSQDLLKDLNENISNFLLLVTPYLNLSCSIKALEWLVRKFNINMYNAENMLLVALSYYKEPVFLKFLNVIPKNSFPKIFDPLAGFKDLLKNPSPVSMLKAFLNNVELFKLYSLFIIEQVKNKLVFKQQLIFLLSMSVQMISANSKDIAKLEQQYLPEILSLVGNLLLPNDTKTANDLKLSAYSLVSVLGSVLPLSLEIVASLSDTIVSNPECFNDKLVEKTLITLGQLYHTTSDASIKYFDILKFEDVVASIVKNKFNMNKFLYTFLMENLNHEGTHKLFKYIIFDDSLFKYAMIGLFDDVESREGIARENSFKCIESLFKSNSDLFKEILSEIRPEMKITDLEMLLMTTLDEKYIETIEIDDDADDEDEEEIEGVQSKLSNVSINEGVKSFLTVSSNVQFNELLDLVLKDYSILKGLETKLKSTELYITFILRLALVQSVPIVVRMEALKLLNRKFNKLIKKDLEFYLLVPLFLLGLHDVNQLIRQSFGNIIRKLAKGVPTKKAGLFLEEEIYNDLPKNKRSILAPKDGNYLLSILDDSSLEDVVIDGTKTILLVEGLFTHAKSNSKKYGANYLKGFVLNQWSLEFLPLTFKSRVWSILNPLNQGQNDYRVSVVENHLQNYLASRNNLIKEANESRLDFVAAEADLVNLVGGMHVNDKFAHKETDIIMNLLIGPSSLQELASDRLILVFDSIKSNDLKFKIVTKLIDSVVNDTAVVYDPFDVLLNLKLDFPLISSVLATVQLNDQVPEQGIVKKKRRSSSQTRQTMARNDINSMASIHLRKVTIILDYLESSLTRSLKESEDLISRPELLIELFKILTDLDYLGNDGHLPVLYAQETLASCMLMSVKLMKSKNYTFDSNSIRADLIVNSIRNSNSPQVQNRLLLVIAELASLAPEIILHSVMPIFTFMGAHTIKQDDEFSNSALQETVSRVIPALAQNGTTNINEDIEFLLSSFVAALQHIPRHRRAKLFSSLVKTLTVEKSLHTILFLVGNQVNRIENHQTDLRNSLVEFSSLLLKNFNAEDQLKSLGKLLSLWDKIPNEPVEKNSEEYDHLLKRPIFGVSLLAMTSEELVKLKISLLGFINEIIAPKDEYNEINLMKLKINMNLLDDEVSEQDKDGLLREFNEIVSFLLRSIDTFSNKKGSKSGKVISNVYNLLNNFLDMLPVTHFIGSIIDSLNPELIHDFISIKIAINFANLTSVKFENDLNVNNITEDLKVMIKTRLIPVLINGFDKNLDLELQQVYLDTFAVIIHKLSSVDSEVFSDSKQLTQALSIIITDKGYLSGQPELIISSINAINNVVEILGVKFIGSFPKVIKPSFDIWNKFADELEETKLVQSSILLLYASIIKKLPAFLGSNIDSIILTILNSNAVENALRAEVLNLLVKHVETSILLKSLISIWVQKKFYENDHTENLGLYLNCVESTIDVLEKKSAIGNATPFLKWLITSFEFRSYCEDNDKFNNNTIHRLEASFHKCGITFIMKLNDKTFRPLFSALTRWAVNGEDAQIEEMSRYLSFFKFFNKLQEELKSIITSYYSYMIEPVCELLNKFTNKEISDVNLKRILLISLNASFKYDQDDYWNQELRFDMLCKPLFAQLSNIEDSIGKYLLKALTNFTANVSSNDHNNVIVQELIQYVSNDNENSSQTKIWCVRALKSIFQKLGENWLSHLPTLVPYIAELLEDEDEAVELEVRRGLVRVIEGVLGEPLDRYLD